MVKLLLSSFTFLLLLLMSFNSQADFRKGFIVTDQKDTIYGEIDYRNDSKLYKECIFRNDYITSVYLPSQIRGYGFVDDRVFISGILVDQFVEFLVDGNLSCYKQNNRYYIRKSEGEIFVLEKTENIINVEGQKYLKRDDRWKRILNILTYDCLHDPETIKNLNYSERSITNIVIDYNKCRNANFVAFKQNRAWTDIDIGIGLGMMYSQLSVTDNKYSYFEDRYISLDPYIGIILNISSPRIFDKLSFQAEVNYSKSDYFSSVIREGYNSDHYYDTYIYFHSVSLPFSAKYKINERNLDFSVQGGLNLNFLFNAGSNVIQESIIDNVVSTYEYGAFEIKENQVGLFGGIEVKKPLKGFKLGINLRYSHFLNLNSLENPMIRYQIFSSSIIIYGK